MLQLRGCFFADLQTALGKFERSLANSYKANDEIAMQIISDARTQAYLNCLLIVEALLKDLHDQLSAMNVKLKDSKTKSDNKILGYLLPIYEHKILSDEQVKDVITLFNAQHPLNVDRGWLELDEMPWFDKEVKALPSYYYKLVKLFTYIQSAFDEVLTGDPEEEVVEKND